MNSHSNINNLAAQIPANVRERFVIKAKQNRFFFYPADFDFGSNLLIKSEKHGTKQQHTHSTTCR